MATSSQDSGSAGAVAAGAILTMIADTMIPEPFERTRTWTGVITTLGFLVAVTIERAWTCGLRRARAGWTA